MPVQKSSSSTTLFTALWLIRQAHYWAGWGMGILALAWFGSGFFMTLKPIEEIRGSHLASEPVFKIDPSEVKLPDIDRVKSVTLISVLGTPAFDIGTATGRQIIDAQNGEPLPEPEENAIRAKAMSLMKNEAQVLSLHRLEVAPLDYSGPLPVWQVQMSEPKGLRLYIDARTGRLSRVRTTRWRWFDIAWRVHILDVSGENFNSWWLKLASGLAALFALSGIILLWRPKRRQSAD